MYAYGRKNEHRAITLALSTISGIVVTIVAAASVLSSGILEKQMRMLVPARPFETFEANINSEVKSLKDSINNIERRLESLSMSSPQEAAAGVEIGKTKAVTMESRTNENKTER
jgi:TolA-binding protein